MIDLAADLSRGATERGWSFQSSAFALGRWTPLQMFDHYARRIARLNPRLNAVLDTRFEAARGEAAESADRWARGAPLSEIDGAVVLVKANIAVEGLPWHAGIKAYERRFARADAASVAALKRAGAVIAGTVNMDEGALGASGVNPWFGPTLNPWGGEDETLSPGGSSGGCAAAVAAGLCVAAIGTDSLGSLRMPAAYCGVAAHKPGPGLVSADGVVPLSPTLDAVGPMTRSARDLAPFLAALSGQPARAQSGLTGLVIGRWRFEEALTADPGVASAFETAIARLEACGARIVDVRPEGYDYGRARRRGLLICEMDGHSEHAAMLAERPEGFSDSARRLLEWGAAQRPDAAEAAHAAVRAAHEDAARWFAACDLVVAPAMLEPAFDLAQPAPPGQADLTAFANLAGCPSTAVPMGRAANGRPVAMQILAPAGADQRALKAAAQFEILAGGPLTPPAARSPS